MVKALPQRFNPDLLARDGTQFKVTLQQSDMHRLREIVSEADQEVHVVARFSRRKEHVLISGRLETVFSMQCQRCLQPMSTAVSESFELVFVANELKAEELTKELDPVVLDEHGHIHVIDLFEDEVMLHVPDIPKHTDKDDCDVGEMEFGDLPVDVEEGKPNPFEALKNLNLH